MIADTPPQSTSFPGAVARMLRFDLRRHRMLAAVVVGLEVVRAAFVEWSLHLAPIAIGEKRGGTIGQDETAVFDVVLWLVTVLTTAMVVQADLPGDERAFWRTRPIPPVPLAVAKLATLALLLVAIPSLINAGRLAAYGAPWPAILAATLQIALTAGALVAPAWALAIGARTLPLFIGIGAALLIGSRIALVAVLSYLSSGGGVRGVALGLGLAWQGSEASGPATRILVTLAALGILVAHYRHRRWPVSVIAGVALVATAAFAPGAPAVPAAPPDLARIVDGQLRLPDGVTVSDKAFFHHAPPGWPEFLTGPLVLPPLPAGVSAAVTLAETRVRVEGRTLPAVGVRQCCSGPGPIATISPALAQRPGQATRSNPEMTVFGIAPPLVGSIAGRRIGIESDADVAFMRHRFVGVLPLRPGAAFRTDAYLIEILSLEAQPAVLLIRYARFPRLAATDDPAASLFVANPDRTSVATTSPAWQVSPHDAASPSPSWAHGRTWVGRFHVQIDDRLAPQAELLIVESRPAGQVRTRLAATDVPVHDRRTR